MTLYMWNGKKIEAFIQTISDEGVITNMRRLATLDPNKLIQLEIIAYNSVLEKYNTTIDAFMMVDNGQEPWDPATEPHPVPSFPFSDAGQPIFHKEWYPFINFNQGTKKEGIKYYMSIKVRKALKTIWLRYGYPVRYQQYIGYYSGLGCWIPNHHIVLQYYTDMLWNDHPKHRWRTIVTAATFPQYSPQALIPFNDLLEIPFILGSMRHLRVFENLGFYNTINDVVIGANWDYILKLLNQWGY